MIIHRDFTFNDIFVRGSEFFSSEKTEQFMEQKYLHHLFINNALPIK